MRKCNKLILFGMLSLFVAAGCSDRSKKAKPEELKVEPVSVQQLSDYRTVFYNKLTEESERRSRGRSFQDSIANYFDRLSFLSDEEKSRLLQEELAWMPMVKRLEELDLEMMKIHDKYYLQYGSVLLEYSVAHARSLKTWSHFTELSHAKEAPFFGDPKVIEEMMNSEFLTEEEKKQLIKDEETMERLKPEVEKIESAIDFESYDEEREKSELIEKMVAIRAENREIWNRIHAEYGEDLESYISEVPMEDFESWKKAQRKSKDRKRDRFAKEWQEELPFLNRMRDLEESIEKFFPQLTFLTEEDKKDLIAEEAEWRALLAERDGLKKAIAKAYDDHMGTRPELYEKYEGMIRKNMDLRWKMDHAALEDRELSEEEKIRKSTVLTEEEKERLLLDQAVIEEIEAEIGKINSVIAEKVEPLERKEEELLKKIEAVHEKNRAIWEKIREKGLKLEISTNYLPPIASDQWFQEK